MIWPFSRVRLQALWIIPGAFVVIAATHRTLTGHATRMSCPLGEVEIRPRVCRAPEFEPPTIVDYRPRSTLVVPAQRVPRSRYPAIDFHGHPEELLGSARGLDSLRGLMDQLNLAGMVAADNRSGSILQRDGAAVRASPLRDRVRLLAGIDFGNVGPGWAARAVRRLEEDAALGAVGIGEIPKSVGLSVRKGDGSRLKLDDPDLDPVWDAAARLSLPVFIHAADPRAFFDPIDLTNERWLELALFRDRRLADPVYPRFAEILAERDAMMRRHPRTTFVLAHLGWSANDLGALGRLLDSLPNVYAEIGAVLYDLGRQPRVARAFFIRYQERLLFGKDALVASEYPLYWRVLETEDDGIEYYRRYHANWPLYGLGLPDSVLRKLYAGNAVKLIPSLAGAVRASHDR